MLLSINFLLEWKRTEKIDSFILFGATSGLLLGIKYTTILYVSGLFIAMLFILSKKKPEDITKLFMLFIFLNLVFGGIWYVRNFYQEGSVFGKLPVPEVLPDFISQVKQFDEYFTPLENLYSSWQHFISYPLFDSFSNSFYSNTSGFGPQLIALVIPSFLFTTFYSFKKKYRPVIFHIFSVKIIGNVEVNVCNSIAVGDVVQPVPRFDSFIKKRCITEKDGVIESHLIVEESIVPSFEKIHLAWSKSESADKKGEDHTQEYNNFHDIFFPYFVVHDTYSD